MTHKSFRKGILGGLAILMIFVGIYFVASSLAGLFGLMFVDYIAYLIGGFAMSICILANIFISDYAKSKGNEEEK